MSPELERALYNLATKKDMARTLVTFLLGLVAGLVGIILMRSPWGLLVTIGWFGGQFASEWVHYAHDADWRKSQPK